MDNKFNPMQSKGGQARADKLDSKTRQEIASKAAKAKWDLPRAKWGTPDNKLKLGDRELECYVLDDGTRVLSGRGMQEALGLGQSHGALLRDFLDQDALKPFMEKELAMELSAPMRFIRPGRGGIPAVAYEATILPRICDAVLEARKQLPKLTKRQYEVAEQCEIITRVLSKVGIIALVDEVTGFQDDRARTALAEILDKFIAEELRAWTKTFPDEFYKEMFRLKKWPYDPNSVKRPSVIGRYTEDLIYKRMAPGVVEELKKKNPPVKPGQRKHKHFQWLTGEVGDKRLRSQIDRITALMKVSDDWDQLKSFVDKAYPIIEVTELGMTTIVKKPKIGAN